MNLNCSLKHVGVDHVVLPCNEEDASPECWSEVCMFTPAVGHNCCGLYAGCNRFLNERLVFGMAPTDTEAAFKQRLRWAMGALQVGYKA